jgi:hypothetical protein
MHKVFSAALVAMLASMPLLAQSAFAQSSTMDQSAKKPPRHVAGKYPAPIDHGPYTAQANQAYQGGGMVRQGAPGAPPPRPQATPPGQTPSNMVSP